MEVKFVDMGWLLTEGANSRSAVHMSSLCEKLTEKHERVALYDYDGQLRAKLPNRETPVVLCRWCPPRTKEDWKDQANCKDRDMYGAEMSKYDRDALIAETCGACPVVKDCLEYGAAAPNINAGFIWGGIYFANARSSRTNMIRRRKVELGIQP